MTSTTQETNTSSPGGVQSVDRAVTILEILARDGDVGVSDIATEIGVHRSTAFRLLSALESRDLVEQNSDRGKYQLGVGILRIAQAVPGQLDLIQQARPVMEEVLNDLQETVNIAVARAHHVVNIDQISAMDRAVTAQNWVGALTPLHATSSGKVLLAAVDQELRTEWIAKVGLKRYTEKTITTAAALKAEMATIRRQGYAISRSEFEHGLNAIAVPVRDRTGKVIAALSVAGPDYRFDDDALRQAVHTLREAGARVSNQMGFFDKAAKDPA